MKTYLIIYFNKANTFSGYAFVVASSPMQAGKVLSLQGRYLSEGYRIISAQCMGETCDCDAKERIIYEGVSPDGLSAYQLAVRAGFKGSLEEWLQSLKGQRGEKGNDGTVKFESLSEAQLKMLQRPAQAKAEEIQQMINDGLLTGPQGPPGPKGDLSILTISADGYWCIDGQKTNTKAQGERGEKGDQGERGIQGIPGEKGDPFTYDDFTPAQLAELKGAKGDTGPRGEQGPRGDFNELTPAQKESLRGPQGPQGEPGLNGVTPEIIDGYWWINGENTNIKAKGIDGRNGIDGKDGATVISTGESSITIIDGYWAIDGEKTEYAVSGPKGDSFTWDDLTDEQKEELIGDSVYHPSESIPNDAEANKVGHLAGSKEELDGLKISELFDRIFFQDKLPYIKDGREDNKFIVFPIEVNSHFENVDEFKALSENYELRCGKFKAGYPEMEAQWEFTNMELDGMSINYGDNNKNFVTANFQLSFPGYMPPLKTLYGKEYGLIQIRPVYYNSIKASIIGFYYWGWSEERTYSPRKEVMSEPLNDKEINTFVETERIFIYLPSRQHSGITIKDLKIRNELSGEFQSIPIGVQVITKELNVSIPELSTLNNYDVYEVLKSKPNSDGSITPNNQPFKISTN